LGYRITEVAIATHYFRKVHYARTIGQRLAVDVYWPNGETRVYALGNPVVVPGSRPPTCKPTVTITLDVDTCHAGCCGPLGAFCDYELDYTLQVTVQTNGCKMCRMWQWVSDSPGIGGRQRDNGLGWPYPWDQGPGACGKPFCTSNDNPGITGKAFCASDLVDDRYFTTCIECQGYCECWTWEIHSRAIDCSHPTCRPVGPYKILRDPFYRCPILPTG
jgi:hypothetical protein